MSQIPFNNLILLNTNIPWMSKACNTPMPLSNNAYLVFRVHGEPNKKKPIILVRYTDDGNNIRLDDEEVTELSINAEGTITTDTIDQSTRKSYWFYPYDENGDIELYDIYVVPRKNTLSQDANYLDQFVPINIGINENQGVNNYLYALYNMPLEATIIDQNADNSLVSNLIKDGQFTNTYLDLPKDNTFEEGQIRNPITQINDNITYEVAYNQPYDDTFFGDILKIESFIGDPEIESSPKNYFKILATNNFPLTPWTYRDIALYFEPYYKFDNRYFTISFQGINNNLDLVPLLPINIGYERYYGDGSIAEGRITLADIDPIILTNEWNKYSRAILIPSNPDIDPGASNTYVKILLRLPTNVNQFDISITNLLLDYGTIDVIYPIDYQNTYPTTVDNYFKPIVNSTKGYIPLSSRAGEIKQFLTPNDTETSILADGRVIYPDDVHYSRIMYPENFNSSNIKDVIVAIPFSNSFKTGLYDVIGYKYGTGSDHFTCDSLHNNLWNVDTAVFDNVFYWNYNFFNPTSDFSGLGDGSIIQAVELHRGQDIPDDLLIKSFFEYNNNNKIWYSFNQNNYLQIAENNGVDVTEYKYSDTIMYRYTGTLPAGITDIQYPAFRNDLIYETDGFYYHKAYFVGSVEDNSFNDSPINVGYPARTINKLNTAGNLGLVDVRYQGLEITPTYSINSEFFAKHKAGAIFTQYNGCQLIAKFSQNNRRYSPGATFSIYNDYMPHDYSIVKIISKNEPFPATNPTYELLPIADSTIVEASVDLITTIMIPTYHQDPQYDWMDIAGNKNTLKKIILWLASQGRKGYGIKFVSTTIADYYGLWFFAQSQATRDVKTTSYTNNIPTITIDTVDDNKFCFYFSNGTTPEPVSPLIPAKTTFIPIIFGAGATIEQISQALEKAVNSYRIQIPDFRGMVLQGQGNSVFEVPNINEDDIQNITPMCNNMRNNEYGIPKKILYEKIFTKTYIDFQGPGTVSGETQSNIYEKVIHGFNSALVYHHISVN